MSQLSQRTWAISFLLALDEAVRKGVPETEMAAEMDRRRPVFQLQLETDSGSVLRAWREAVMVKSDKPRHSMEEFHKRDAVSWLTYALSQKKAEPFYRLIGMEGFSGMFTAVQRGGVSMPALHAVAYENYLIGFNALLLNEMALHGEDEEFWGWLDTARDETGATLLCRAGLTNSAIFRQLLALGVNPTCSSVIHKTVGLPLHATIIGDQKDSFGLLLPMMSLHDLAFCYGELDALGLATALGKSWALQPLIDAINTLGAFRSTRRYGGGNTVMHLSAVSNDLATVQFWIDKAPELLNESNIFGHVPLVGALSIPNPPQDIVMAFARAGSLLDESHAGLAEALSGGDLKEFLLKELKRRANIERLKQHDQRDFSDPVVHQHTPILFQEERVFE